jgi:hypothetical protein
MVTLGEIRQWLLFKNAKIIVTLSAAKGPKLESVTGEQVRLEGTRTPP